MTLVAAPEITTSTAPGSSTEQQHRGWNLALASSRPCRAISCALPGRLRVAVLDSRDANGMEPDEIDDLGVDWAHLTAAQAADALVSSASGPAACTSVAIADLWPDGILDVQTRNAPPAIHLSPGRGARLLPGTSRPPALRRLGLADLLVLCSAAFLEEPPAVLGTLRRPVHDAQRLAGLQRRIAQQPARGAVATAQRPPIEAPRWIRTATKTATRQG